MQSLNFELLIVFLLLYVKLNATLDCAVDCNEYANNVTQWMNKDLLEYKTKFEQLMIKNPKSNASECVDAKLMKLEQQLAAQRQEFELQIKQFQAKLEEQQRVIIELQADKAKLTADLNPATSCVYAGAAIQWIHIPGTDAFQLPCDSTLPNKPYAIIQRRNRGIVNFDRAWHEYKNGFGDLQGEFWLGLERLHQLTKFQPHELLIQLENAVGARLFIRYTNFSIGNESESYKILTAVPQSGNNNTIEPLKFTTSDRDNDNDVDDNCAVDFASGWWFNDCYRSHCNGVYQNSLIPWSANDCAELPSQWYEHQLRFTQIMIKTEFYVKKFKPSI